MILRTQMFYFTTEEKKLCCFQEKSKQKNSPCNAEVVNLYVVMWNHLWMCQMLHSSSKNNSTTGLIIVFFLYFQPCPQWSFIGMALSASQSTT